MPSKSELNADPNLGFVSESYTAALLGISIPTLKNRQSKGNAPPKYKVGRNNLYDPTEIRAWIKRRRVLVGERGRP